MKYISTRNIDEKVSFSQAVINGLASNGGLYVPEEIPAISNEEIKKMIDMSYQEIATEVLSKFMTDFTVEEIDEICSQAYSKFYGEVAPVVKITNDFYILELFHGPTMAFKDVALTFLPYVLIKAMEKCGIKENVMILVATSGDTGKAALEGFKDIDKTKIMVFYPSEGVSDVQKLQMVSQEGDNVYVVGVDGNFDNCQTGVKEIFSSSEFEKECKDNGYVISSANSINFGRLLPQIVYYFSSYFDLVQSKEIDFGDKVNFSVPTGNFGDIFAGYYAKKMGLPINMLLCASNDNKVLTDFFSNGEYNMEREFVKTMSPSMDILNSSNLERLIFENCNRDDKLTKERMQQLKSSGKYQITDRERLLLEKDFYAEYASEEETKVLIGSFFEENDYPLDPHTAVGVYVSDIYKSQNDDENVTIALSTASPYKFLEDVMACIKEPVNSDIFKNAKRFYETSGISIPEPFKKLKDATEKYNKVISKDDMMKEVKEFIKG